MSLKSPTALIERVNRINIHKLSTVVMAGGAAFLATGATQIVDSQRDSGADVVGLGGHLALGFLALGLILIAPMFLILGRHVTSRYGRVGAVAAATGTFVLGLTATSSLINGSDLALFNVLAPLTNAAWLFGSIALAVALKRAGQVPAAVAIALPFVWFVSIPLSVVGGGVLAGAFWIAVAWMASAGLLGVPATRRVPASDAPSAA